MKNLNPRINKKVKKIYYRRLLDNSIIGILIPFIVITVIVSLLRPNFLGANNIYAILKALPFLGLVAIGETLVILAGEIDISVGSVAGLGAIISTWIMTSTPLGVSGGIVFSLIACGILGLINGICIVKIRIPAFITTIGMLYIARGLVMLISKGYPIYPLPESMLILGEISPFRTSIPFIVFIFMIILFEFILRKTTYGRNIYATGNNKEVAKLSGINIDFIKISTFVITSILAALSGIFIAAQLQTGSPGIGTGWELQVIAATSIGGISLAGGMGSMIGTMLGIFILAVLNNGLVLLGINTFIQSVVTGAIMLIAVYADTLRRNSKLF